MKHTSGPLLLLLAILFAAVPVCAQEAPQADPPPQELPQQEPPLPFGDLGGGFGGDQSEFAKPTVEISLHPADAKRGDTVILGIRITVPEGYYTYDLARPDDTELMKQSATRVQLTGTAGLEAIDEAIKADRAAKTVVDKYVGKVREFEDQVTLFRRFRLATSDPTSIAVEGSVRLQICNKDGCLPPETFPIAIALGDGPELDVAVSDEHPLQYSQTPSRKVKGQDVPGPVSWTFQLSPQDAKPGDTVTLSLTAKLEETYHIFALSQDKQNAGLPTRITLTGLRGLKSLDDAFVENRDYETSLQENTVLKKTYEQRFFHGEVTWSRKFQVSADPSKRGLGVMGEVRYQFCDPVKCTKAKTTFALGQVDSADAIADKTAGPVQGDTPLNMGSLLLQSAIGFLAGFLLNFMPCVLPVIGLKIVSFVNQSGQSRGRTFLLNVWFSLGLMSVFLILATLVGLAGQGWGSQFTSLTFNIVLAAVVFVFALSFLGVWEIPIPGFSSTGDGQGDGKQEGAFGAFTKGVLTTVLATPCTGPLLVPAMSWAVGEGPMVTYVVLMSVGLGMALPYLVIGAFPELIGFIPRPGAWMETFKHIMGFVLLGTVIYPMYILSGLEPRIVVPTLLFLFGLWAAVWWIGRVPLTKPRSTRLFAWAQASIFGTLMGLVSFGVFYSHDDGFWTPYSEELLASTLAENKVVIIDFTADW